MDKTKFKILMMILALILFLSIGYVIYLLMQTDENAQILSKKEQEDLLQRIESGDPSSYTDYLQDGSKLNFVYEDGDTPLEKLIYANDFTGAKQIIDTGFNLNQIENVKPVVTITKILDYNRLRLLEDINAIAVSLVEQIKDDVWQTDEYGYPLLFHAIRTNNTPVVNEILKHVSDLERTFGGHTALSYAAYYGAAPAVIYALLEHGADVNARINLDSLGLKQVSPAMVYVIFQGAERAGLLPFITHDDFNPNLVDEQGYTLLHYAVEYERLEMVQEILKQTDIDLSIKSNDDETALELAQRLADEQGELFLYDEIEKFIVSYMNES